MSELVPDERTRTLLLSFWNSRNFTRPADQCPAPLKYKNGTTGRCVLHRDHLDGEVLQANVPHADEDGRLAGLLVSWETIREARKLAEERQ